MRVAVRSWLIRGFILAGVAVLIALVWVASSWVSPERVRAQVIASLNDQFQDVDVHVGSARMRILGGISVTDLRITRRSDPQGQPFLVVPSAIVYHDKEQLSRGRLVIRKVELENPELHLERSAAGVWNYEELLKPGGPADKPVPTLVAKGATITVVDRQPNALPALTLQNARITLLNDPLPLLTVEVEGNLANFGPVQARIHTNRLNQHATLRVTLPELPVREVLATAARLAPDLAPQFAGLTATASLSADLSFTPERAMPWRHDIQVDIQNGRFEHPELPHPIEQLVLKARSVDGRIRIDEASGKLGPAQVKLSLEARANTAPREVKASTGEVLDRLEEQLENLDLVLTGVPLDEALFTRLGERGAIIQRMFSPSGTADFAYKFSREATGWKREFELRPQSMALVYEKFRYPLTDVHGWVKRTITHTGQDNTHIDLRGMAGGKITVKGQVSGTGDDPAISLRVTGTDVPLDDKLVAALPGKYPNLIRQFHATGRGDFVAEITQLQDVNLSENEFRIDIRDGTVAYEKFPYPLEKVKGRLVVRTEATDKERPIHPGEAIVALPDRDELILDGFTALHGGASIWMHGSKRPVPDTPDRLLVLHLGGNTCPIDADLKKALTKLELDGIWSTFDPRGAVTFAADVEVIDRGAPEAELPFDAARDLKLTFNFFGPTVTPRFFPYELTDLAGWLEYRDGRLDLAHFAARHGTNRLKLDAGEVRFYPDGAVWANLGGLELKPFVTDEAFLKALPGKLRSGFEELKLKGGADLNVKHLVVLTPPDAPALPPPELNPIGPRTNRTFTPSANLAARTPASSIIIRGQAPSSSAASATPDPIVYWDTEVKLAGASLNTGVAWEELFGSLACRGRYDGTHLSQVRGNLWLDRAVVAKQPVTGVKAHVRVLPQKPDPARPGEFLPIEMEFTDVSGSLFHGTLGGEARVVLAAPVRYELWLTASDVQLDEVARHYKLGSDADLKGLAQAQIRLYNRPDPQTGQWSMEGSGKIDVPNGRMYNLPILLDLVKMLKLQTPDKTAFEEAHAIFRIQGNRVKIDQLDLIGNAICLGGSGELDTSGEYVHFEFYTIWSKMLKQMINTPVGDLTAFLSKNLFRIKLTRENGELRYRPEAVPVVTDPAKNFAERLKSRTNRMLPK